MGSFQTLNILRNPVTTINTITDGGTESVSSDAIFDALAAKSDSSHTHSDLLSKTGGSMTGAITALRETKVYLGLTSNIDLSTGNFFTKTITALTTFTISNALSTGNANSFILELTNGGAYTITWFASVKWAGGLAPTLTASGIDILGFYSHDGGVTWRGLVLAKDSK